MNLVPSDHPRLAGAASLSKPGFDILLAVSSARQSALPTARLLRAREMSESRRAKLNALCEMLGGRPGDSCRGGGRPVRFLDLSDGTNGLPETMNGLFTRGFQPMLNPSHINRWSSALPTPPDEVIVE
ncbi:MAG: hypothetical protein C0520_01215 [Sphingopyxis sp.]|nr:hypothetical protein [Sphingopyxis sp.]